MLKSFCRAILLAALVKTGPTVVEGTLLLKEVVVDINLDKLRAALLASDGASVLQITDDLRRPFLEKKVRVPFASKAASFLNSSNEVGKPFAETKVAPTKLQLTSKAAGSCIFDDQLFTLTPEAKAEVKKELESSTLRTAVAWVRHGGWWDCGVENAECKCRGNVRMVDINRKQLAGSKVVSLANTLSGSIPCTGASFGVTRPEPLPEWPSPAVAACECKVIPASEVDDGFHLEKRLTSKNHLQEAWIFLLRLLARAGQIPMGTGDRTYSGMENWASRAGDRKNFGNAVVLERFWLAKYTQDIVAKAVHGPRCLEWGNPKKPGKEFLYSGLVAGCTQKYDLQYDYIYWQGAGKGIYGNVVHSDILSLPDILATQGLQMDAIFATQVFEHLAEPALAAAALFRATAPNGIVIVTAPQNSQFHKVPHDYFRYTKEGLKYLLIRAGFCVPNAFFAGGGDFVFDIARDAGLQVQDFALDEVEAGWQVGYDKISHSAITIHVLAMKPPHPWCQNSTAGWKELMREGIPAA